jgi:hypothetical protein
MTKVTVQLPDFECKGLTPTEMEAVRGLIWTLRAIQEQTGYGNIHIAVVNGEAAEFDVTQKVRPKLGAPWRAKTP